MPHGYPPWAGIKTATIYGLPRDLAELAVRLGSPDSHDRRGNVVFMDDFSESWEARWHRDISYDNWPFMCDVAARSGASAVVLIAPCLEFDGCGMEKHWPLPVKSKIGLELSFSLTERVYNLAAQMSMFDGEKLTYFLVAYRPTMKKIEYMDKNGDWQDLITDVDLYKSFECFHTLKMVGDYKTAKYVRVIINEREVPMADIDCQSAPSTTTPHLYVALKIWGDGNYPAERAYVCLDDVILTQNED